MIDYSSKQFDLARNVNQYGENEVHNFIIWIIQSSSLEYYEMRNKKEDKLHLIVNNCKLI